MTNTAINTKINGIQRGDNTHHQDQSILPVNFNTMKINNNGVVIDAPLEEVFSLIVAILNQFFKNMPFNNCDFNIGILSKHY